MNQSKEKATPDEYVVSEIMNALKDLRYGSVEIVVQDGKVVQLERREKRRLSQEEKIR